MKLVFATNNQHKLDEIRKITNGLTEIVSLAEINCHDDIPETADTLEGNALQKARYIKEHFGLDCFADDTGNKLLQELQDKDNRKARFRTVIALILNGKEYLFEGIINGTITREKRGGSGFGYDPLFVPDNYSQTFAEMGNDIKNQISHRAQAVKKLTTFLSNNIF